MVGVFVYMGWVCVFNMNTKTPKFLKRHSTQTHKTNFPNVYYKTFCPKDSTLNNHGCHLMRKTHLQHL